MAMNDVDFREFYIRNNPGSIPKRVTVESRFPWWAVWGSLVLFVFSALASGVHTIPIVEAGIPASSIPYSMVKVAAYGSFIAIELALMLSAFLMNHDRTKWYARAMFLVSASAAIAANILSVQSAFAANDAEQSIVVVVMFGVVFPLGALISGVMFVAIRESDVNSARHTEKEYTRVKIAWDKEIQAAHAVTIADEEKRARRQARTEQPVALTNNGHTNGGGAGYRRGGGGVQAVLAAVMADPTLAALSARDMALRIDNVQKSTVSSAMTHEEKQHIAAGSMVIVHDGEKYVIQEVQ